MREQTPQKTHPPPPPAPPDPPRLPGGLPGPPPPPARPRKPSGRNPPRHRCVRELSCGCVGQDRTMASLRIHSDRINVILTPAEKELAVRRDDLVGQRPDIRAATIAKDPWVWLRGIRRRGSELPLLLAVGTWRYHGGTDFVIVKGKRPALVLEFSAGEDARIWLPPTHAAAVIDQLKLQGLPES